MRDITTKHALTSVWMLRIKYVPRIPKIAAIMAVAAMMKKNTMAILISARDMDGSG